jgi:hypothetical protein
VKSVREDKTLTLVEDDHGRKFGPVQHRFGVVGNDLLVDAGAALSPGVGFDEANREFGSPDRGHWRRRIAPLRFRGHGKARCCPSWRGLIMDALQVRQWLFADRFISSMADTSRA